MPINTQIPWTNATWNPWVGCRKRSPGCAHCYMFRDQIRYGRNPGEVVRTSDKTFYAPLKWKEPQLIFTCSWSDFFIEEADGWRREAYQVIEKTPQHTYQILTKRPERIDRRSFPENCWVGVSVENPKSYWRIEELLKIDAKVRFLSIEPMLGSMPDLPLEGIQWVIIGGESGGEEARPTSLSWIREVINRCNKARVQVFVKQLGRVWAKRNGAKDKKGGDTQEWPEDLRIRQFPSRAKAKRPPQDDIDGVGTPVLEPRPGEDYEAYIYRVFGKILEVARERNWIS